VSAVHHAVIPERHGGGDARDAHDTQLMPRLLVFLLLRRRSRALSQRAGVTKAALPAPKEDEDGAHAENDDIMRYRQNSRSRQKR